MTRLVESVLIHNTIWIYQLLFPPLLLPIRELYLVISTRSLLRTYTLTNKSTKSFSTCMTIAALS